MQRLGITRFALLASVLMSLAACADDHSATEQLTADEVPVPAKVEVTVSTTMGDIVVELDGKNAPVTVDNFLHYTNSYFYDGMIFHRVVKDFVIQSGGHMFDLSEKENTRGPIVNESSNGLSNLRGTIAMARMPDPDSAGSQFYINLVDNTRLDAKGAKPGYTVFGRVIAGMEVVDAIGAVEVEDIEDYQNVPVENITITSVRVTDSQASN